MRFTLILLAFIAMLLPHNTNGVWSDGSQWCPPDMVVSPDGFGCDPIPRVQYKSCPNGGLVRIDGRCPLRGYIEHPRNGDFVSGISAVSGWLCDAKRIVVEFDRDRAKRFFVPYGGTRTDTRIHCLDSRNGFSLLLNWNLLGEGKHTMRLWKDGAWWKNRDGSEWEISFTVTTLGEEFAENLQGECLVQDFPDEDETTQLVWSETLQNFVITP